VSPILKLALLTVAIIGGWSDFRTRRIPNWLNLSGLILGVGLNTLFLQAQGLKLAAAGLGLALLIYLPLYLIRAMGAGDVKFMVAVGALVGPENWLNVFLTTAILGGIASLCLIAARSRLQVTLSNMSTITNELMHGRLPFHKDPSLDVHDQRALGLPHGTLIAISVCIFLAFLHRAA
jgi:prepilin peptidase CpaA